MLVRRTSTALAIAGLTGMGITAFATPALAVETVLCTNPPTTVQLGGNGPWQFNTFASCNSNPEISIKSTADDPDGLPLGDITVFSDPGGGGFTGNFTADITNDARSSRALTGDGSEVTYTGAATSGTIIVVFTTADLVVGDGQTFEITLGGGGGDDTPSVDSGSTDVVSGPGPHIQQFAMPETGTCDAAQPEGLNWGGVASGGWGESWAQWMNDGAGGDVCTRTLVYNQSTAAWEVE